MKLSREILRKVKAMPLMELNDYLKRLYILGFTDGLREGEREFEDAVILTEDEALDRLGEEAVERLLRG